MKTTRYLKWAVLALVLASGWSAAAQPNRVPGPTDYEQFSAFITTRNIFDPNRYAIRGSQPVRQNRRPTYAPSFTLVGTMSYEKGMFAFFDGNQPELRKVLYPSESNGIAVFTVAGITSTNVTLQTTNEPQTVLMRIGQTMRQEGGSWQPSDSGQRFGGAGSGDSAVPAAADNSSPNTSSAPASAGEPNDVLKKLMQQREQELK